MLLHCGEAKVFTAEEEQRIEQDDGGVGPELFTVPQKLLLDTRVDITRGILPAAFTATSCNASSSNTSEGSRARMGFIKSTVLIVKV